MLESFFSTWDQTQKESFRKVREAVSLPDLLKILDGFAKLKVFVVGEPIVDTYIFCDVAGVSSKTPTVSARYISHEDYAGGSLAIANHLAVLGCRVSLLIPHGNESFFQNVLKDSMNPAVRIESHVIPGLHTPRKTRYLTHVHSYRIFEFIDLDDNLWETREPLPFVKQMSALSSDQDITIVADFGHGLFEGTVLQALEDLDSFLALNVQTNSANVGFNPFTKHRHYDYLSGDKREIRIATHDRFTSIRDLARITVREKIAKPASITLGVDGSVYFDAEFGEHLSPSFFKYVIDTTGAGDAYFAITSLLVKLGVPPVLVPFLGNCYAGLKSRILGNKQAVPKADLAALLKMMWEREA